MHLLYNDRYYRIEPDSILACVQVGAIVPWNYPFHNVFNPLSAAVYAGNAIVIKVAPSLSLGLLA